MGILVYLLILRLKRIFDIKAHPVKTISILLAFIFAVFYGVLFSSIYNSIDTKKIYLSKHELELYLILTLMIITLIRGFFPSYQSIKIFIPQNFPVAKVKKFFYNLLNEFICPYYLGLILFTGTFSFLMKGDRFIFIINTLLWITIIHLFKRILQLFIEFRTRKSIILIIPFVTGVFILLSFLYFRIDLINYNLIASIFLLTLLISNIIIENSIVDSKQKTMKETVRKQLTNPVIKIIVGNSKLRTILISSLLVKFLLVLTNANMLLKSNDLPGFYLYLVNLFLSPAILFTYILNNTFGYLRSMWLTMNKAGVSLIYYSKNIFKIYLVMILPDAIITFLLEYFFNLLSIEYILIYVTSGFVLLIIGIVNSFYFPKKIESLFSFRNNTSLRANLISIITVTLIIFITNISIIFSLFVSISGSIVIYNFFRNRILRNRYKIFSAVYR